MRDVHMWKSLSYPKSWHTGLKLTLVLISVFHSFHFISSTLNSVIVNGSCLTQLTLKRNIPNNMFLNEIGRNCPCLQELDIAGAEVLMMNRVWKFHMRSTSCDVGCCNVEHIVQVVTDFGIVCLLYADPEQIFLKCWNRERTVGQQKRC